MLCPEPTCAPGMCAQRKGSCCDYECQLLPESPMEQLSRIRKEVLKNHPMELDRGCEKIFQSQGNGKLEWFEKQSWYLKVAELCKSMKRNDVMGTGDFSIERQKQEG